SGGAGVRETLEALMLPALARTPCMVAFSGGQDSSAVLAVATDVARRAGLEDPIPLTFRYPDHPRTWESEWQELVVRHLELDEWKIVEFRAEFDVLGSMARDTLRRHGLFWPPNAHTRIPMLEAARGGTLLSGNGGDEVFSAIVKPKKLTRMQMLRSMPPRRACMTILVNALPLRWKTLMQHKHGLRFPWLRPGPRREVRRRFVENAVRLRREENYLQSLDRSRYLELQRAIREALTGDTDVTLVEPFFEPRFLAALSAATPPAGFLSRNAAMEHFFGDLVPQKLLQRTSKAVFTESFWGGDSRGFAQRWDGGGLDASLVYPDVLRDQWLRPKPDLRSATAMQAAWLSSGEAAGNSNDFHT
ncbi:MAG TPA: asparagine synthase-related protein, partial [Gemmatimonadota bacterium]|nr:asparagine synthase-related protein [Gemmatimonadota bacterium]